MPAIQIPEKLEPVLHTKKRFVVLIGGRSSAKSETVARIILLRASTEGVDVLCGREYQNSIEDSVHKLLKQLILELDIDGFDITDKKIDYRLGNSFRFRGFARNSTAVKSAQNFKYSWIEEAQTLSQASIDDLLPTIRAEGSQLFFTANPGSSNDPFSKRFIVPFLREIKRDGFYEDDLHLIILANWRDNPWHGELEDQRVWDRENLSRAKYDHIWEGEFNDSVEDPLILAEWFDAAIDAHKKLGFEPTGVKVVSHDPSDTGDPRATALRHGSCVIDVDERLNVDINDACDWAMGIAVKERADLFTWDADGAGIGLKRQVRQSMNGKKVDYVMFKGSNGPDDPSKFYSNDGINEKRERQKTNKETFRNKRAQYYWLLRDRFYNTYLAVRKEKYIDPDRLISISSKIKNIQGLRSELCRLPLKPNHNGMIQLFTKQEMKSRLKIASPNMADAVMMSFIKPSTLSTSRTKIRFKSLW